MEHSGVNPRSQVDVTELCSVKSTCDVFYVHSFSADSPERAIYGESGFSYATKGRSAKPSFVSLSFESIKYLAFIPHIASLFLHFFAN